MEFYQREYFLSRIKLGHYRIPYNGDIYKIYPADEETEYLAHEEYIRALSNEDCYSQEDAVNLLIDEGSWNVKLENELSNILPKHIEYWKTTLYEKWFRLDDRPVIKKHLAAAQEEEARLTQIKSKYYQHTREYLASYSRDLFVLSRMTRCNGKRVNWHNVDITQIHLMWQLSFLSPVVLKEIARSTSWNNYVLACKGNRSKLFKGRLTIEQKLLLQYTSFYHNIRRHPDCPGDEIVEDDDALEGWVIIKNREAEVNRNKKQFDNSLGSKVSKAGEVYLPAQSTAEIQRIDGLNSPQAKMIKRQRNKQLANSGGILRQDQFLDVQVEQLNKGKFHNG